MSMTKRRSFLKLLGLGTAALPVLATMPKAVAAPAPQAHKFLTDHGWADPEPKLHSFRNNGVEICSVDKNGVVHINPDFGQSIASQVREQQRLLNQMLAQGLIR